MNKSKIFFITLLTITYSILLSSQAHASTIDWSRYSSLRERIRSEYRHRTISTPVRPETNLTQTPTQTAPTSSPTPTKIFTASPTPTTIQVTPTPTTSSSDSKKNYIMNAINTYRKSKGLSSVKTDSYTCSFAKVRAKEISTNFSHDGFNTRVANKTLPYPGYSLVTENLAMTSNYLNVVNMWINSPGHAENMRKNTPYVCVEYFGNYYAYEGWKP